MQYAVGWCEWGRCVNEVTQRESEHEWEANSPWTRSDCTSHDAMPACGRSSTRSSTWSTINCVTNSATSRHANKKLEQGNEQGSGRGNEKNCSTKCETSARDWARELWPLEMTCTLVCDFPYFHSFRSLDLSSFIIFPSSLSFYRSLLWFIVCHFYFICSFYRFVNFLLLYLIFFLLSISCCCSSFVVWFSFSVLLISHTLDSYSLSGLGTHSHFDSGLDTHGGMCLVLFLFLILSSYYCYY